MQKLPLAAYAPIVLRLAMSAVFVWFGASQLAHPSMWYSLVPDWASKILDTGTILTLNGVFEIAAGTLLAIGAYVRPIAFILGLHLLVITSHLGFGPVGTRDFGLSFATFATALFGYDRLCVLARKQDLA